MYFMQLVELALIMQDNSASPKIKSSEPLRLVAKLTMQNSWFPVFSGRRCLGLTGLVWLWSETRENDRRENNRPGPAGWARGRSLSAPDLGKSRAGEREHNKPTSFICCEEGTNSRDSPCLHLFPELLCESFWFFLFFSLREEPAPFFSPTMWQVFFFPCFFGVLFRYVCVFGGRVGECVVCGVKSGSSISGTYLLFTVPCGHLVAQ